MSAILTDEGADDQLAKILASEGSALRVGLFTSISVSTKAAVMANVGVATFSGYAEQTPVFAVTTDSAAGRSRATAAELTFTHNGGGTSNSIAGYYLKHVTSGKLWFFEVFGAAINMAVNGNNIKITPTLFYGSLTPPL